jgi:ferredoxin
MNFKKIFLPFFLIIGTVSAFIISVIKPNTNSAVKITSPNSNSIYSKHQNPDKTAFNPQNLQKLSVLALRCIGCGKCVRIDSSHFQINPSTGKSIVISATNLNSTNLALAISNCPVQAITLE